MFNVLSCFPTLIYPIPRKTYVPDFWVVYLIRDRGSQVIGMSSPFIVYGFIRFGRGCVVSALLVYKEISFLPII